MGQMKLSPYVLALTLCIVGWIATRMQVGYPVYVVFFMMVLNSFLVFVLTHIERKRILYSICAIVAFSIFFLFSPFMIHNNFLHISILITFFLALSIAFLLWIQHNNYLFFLVGYAISAITLIIIPEVAIFFAATFSGYILFDQDKISSLIYRQRKYFYPILLGIVVYGYYLISNPNTQVISTLASFPNPLISISMIVPMISAVCGALYLLLRNKSTYLLWGGILALLNIYLSYMTGLILFIQWEDQIILLLLILSILSGIGLGSILIMLKVTIKDKTILCAVTIGLLVAFVLPYLSLVI